MGKGEIACYEQFLLFPLCFQKACFPGASKGVIVWEWVKSMSDNKILGQSRFKAVAGNIIIKCCQLKELDSKRVESRKHGGKKESMLVTSIFCFSQNVFKRLFCQGHYDSGLCNKRLQNDSPFFPVPAIWGPDIADGFIQSFPDRPLRGHRVKLECLAYGT